MEKKKIEVKAAQQKNLYEYPETRSTLLPRKLFFVSTLCNLWNLLRKNKFELKKNTSSNLVNLILTLNFQTHFLGHQCIYHFWSFHRQPLILLVFQSMRNWPIFGHLFVYSPMPLSWLCDCNTVLNIQIIFDYFSERILGALIVSRLPNTIHIMLEDCVDSVSMHGNNTTSLFRYCLSHPVISKYWGEHCK